MLARMERFTSMPHASSCDRSHGSGKSTTLYSALKRINLRTNKIITIEIRGIPDGWINQIHVNPQIGLTFASGLRHIVARIGRDHGRRNPRPRDSDSPSAPRSPAIGVQHAPTNDAPSAITRRGDGVEISDHVVAGGGAGAAVGARDLQFLQQPNGTALSPEGEAIGDVPRAGCEHCRQPGYTSRFGIFEMMDVTDEIRKMIMKNEDASVLTRRRAATHAESFGKMAGA